MAVIFITTTSSSTQTYPVPSDWNSANNFVEAIGGGAGGDEGQSGGGGGGGAYTKATNISLTPGGTTSFQIGLVAVGGTQATVVAGANGVDTWFVSNVTVLAKAGVSEGAGGAASGCVPSGTAFSGGAGSGAVSYNVGGGGAGGPHGAGQANGATSTNPSGSGGGGAGGGSATGGATSTSGAGGAGGTAQDGTAGGAGGTTSGTTATSGITGSHGSGGGGGGGTTSGASAAGDGGPGGPGIEWVTAGAGGGGGAAGSTQQPATGTTGTGGAGGLYGGGGGAGGYDGQGLAFGSGGNGGQGIIVLTYTPASSFSSFVPGGPEKLSSLIYRAMNRSQTGMFSYPFGIAPGYINIGMWVPRYPDRSPTYQVKQAEVQTGMFSYPFAIAPSAPPTLDRWTPRFTDRIQMFQLQQGVINTGLFTYDFGIATSETIYLDKWIPRFVDRLPTFQRQQAVVREGLFTYDFGIATTETIRLDKWQPRYTDRIPHKARMLVQPGYFGYDSAIIAGQLTTVNNLTALTGGVLLPAGTTTQRPAVSALYNGLIRYNTSNNLLEAVVSGAYVFIETGSTSGFLLNTNNLSDVASTTTALNNLLPSQTSHAGSFLTTNGTNTSWTTIGTGTVTSFNLSGGSTGLSLSGGPITGSGTLTFSGTLAVASGGTGQSTWQAALTTLGYSVNAPGASATNITLTNPLGTLQKIQFSATGKNLILPQMNAAASIPLGWTIFITNVGSNAFSIVAQDSTTVIYNNVLASETIILTLIKNTTANGTFNVIPAILASNNLSELTNAAAARSNLGLGTSAVASTSSFLTVANNLSDVASVSLSRTNLGLGSLATASTINNSNWSGSPMSVSIGGTGQASLTAHGVLVGEGTSAITSVGPASGTIFSGNGSTTDPSFTITPTLGVNGTTSGTLGFANGGSLGVTVTLKNLGTTSAYNFNLPTSAGSSAQVLTSAAGGSNPMTWTTLAASATTDTTNASNITSGSLPLAQLPTIVNNTVFGNVSVSPAVPSAVTPVQILTIIGNTQGNILYNSGSSTWSVLAPGTAGQFLQTQGAAANPQWASISSGVNAQTFPSSNTWTKPIGTRTWIQVWGAGGGGGGGGAGVFGGGGGGGGYSSLWIATASLPSTVTVTIGTGGSGGGSTQVGAAGGNTTFGAFVTGYGGGGGYNDNAANPPSGGGGGLSGPGGTAGTTSGGVGGAPIGAGGQPGTGNICGGGAGGTVSGQAGGDSFYGGGGGGGGIGYPGGNSVYGGGGGYHGGSGGNVNQSNSVYGGSGGGYTTTNGQSGVVPGGGGGGGASGSTSGGTGANGQCIVITFP